MDEIWQRAIVARNYPFSVTPFGAWAAPGQTKTTFFLWYLKWIVTPVIYNGLHNLGDKLINVWTLLSLKIWKVSNKKFLTWAEPEPQNAFSRCPSHSLQKSFTANQTYAPKVCLLESQHTRYQELQIGNLKPTKIRFRTFISFILST